MTPLRLALDLSPGFPRIRERLVKRCVVLQLFRKYWSVVGELRLEYQEPQ
jgi:hypothetical protein